MAGLRHVRVGHIGTGRGGVGSRVSGGGGSGGGMSTVPMGWERSGQGLGTSREAEQQELPA